MTADTSNMATSNDVKQVPDEEDENQWREFAKFLYEYFEVAQKWEEIQKFVEVHPAISVFLIVTLGMCSVPVVIFSMFVISSIALSIFGFFLFEGKNVSQKICFIGYFSIPFSMQFYSANIMLCFYNVSQK